MRVLTRFTPDKSGFSSYVDHYDVPFEVDVCLLAILSDVMCGCLFDYGMAKLVLCVIIVIFAIKSGQRSCLDSVQSSKCKENTEVVGKCCTVIIRFC